MDLRRNIRLLLEYDGTGYHGWQRQLDAATAHVGVIGSDQRDLGIVGDDDDLHLFFALRPGGERMFDSDAKTRALRVRFTVDRWTGIPFTSSVPFG